VTVVTDKYAKAVLLHGSDNYFDLLPGERRTIQYHKLAMEEQTLSEAEYDIELFGWN